MSDLKAIFDKRGCDKASKHMYHKVYEKYMEGDRLAPINILEIGVFKGNSIEAWIDYFPNATVYGADIFVRVPPSEIEILSHPRVRWAKCDSTSEEETEALWPDVQFDFIIDDGLHTPLANKQTLDNLVGKLKPSGKYFIEDVFPIDVMTDQEMRHPWIQSRLDAYNPVSYADFKKSLQQHPYLRYDFRAQTGMPDSCVFVVSK